MYEVYLDGKLLYFPGDKINSLVATLLNTKLNDSGAFEITVPPTNPLYNAFELRKSELTVKKDGKEIWNGEVRSSKENLKKENIIYAVGELAYLNASSQPQKKYTNITPLQMLTALLVEHNSRVEARKQFTVGIVTVGSSIYDWTTNYENTLDYIRSEMCEKLDGYLRIRKENGIRYLDLVRLQDYGKTCQQPIKFGKNMLDYASGLDADAIVTAIRPLGATLENSSIEGVEAYLTIESVNDGKDFIENTDAINSGIGYVWQTVHFNVLTDPNALKVAGQNWLQAKQFENMTISITAVDLSELDSDIQSFDLGDSVRTIAKPFGMDKWSYITEKKLDLLNPATRHNISIGEQVKKSYTQQITSEQNTLKNQIPQQGILLELAKKNASEILKHATEGNIYFVNDDDGVPKELLIMDTPDINTAKKVWRWNINGLAYSANGYEGPYKVAITMDGAIVCNFMTVGEFSADRISGGSIRTSSFISEGTVTKYATDYTQADLDRANLISIGSEVPTLEDLEKLDINGDGTINVLDIIRINRFIQGLDAKYDIPVKIIINPLSSQNVIKTDGVAIGVNGAYFENSTHEVANIKELNVMATGSGFRKGVSGTFTTSSGSTVTVTGGVITSIS